MASSSPSYVSSSKASPVANLTKRLGMYKVTTPPWKERFRSCIQRLKESRGNLFNLRRGDGRRVDDLMNSQLAHLQNETGLAEEEFNAFIHVFNEIRDELIEEENRLIAQYEAQEQFESEALSAALSTHTAIPCPTCMQSQLSIDCQNAIVSCTNCKLSIKITEEQIRSPEELYHRLQRVIVEHQIESKGTCQELATFYVQSKDDVQQLISSCTNCGFHKTVF